MYGFLVACVSNVDRGMSFACILCTNLFLMLDSWQICVQIKEGSSNETSLSIYNVISPGNKYGKDTKEYLLYNSFYTAQW